MQAIPIRTEFPHQIHEIENTWIPMPDGIKLAARIWLPNDANENPIPAILEYLPYRKRDGTVERDQLTHPYFAGFGYAGVRVDMRGTGDSEGVCLGEYLKQEQDDCLAVIDWISQQPWCSGEVGMIGISWGGFNGLQVAAKQPPALKAVISICSTDDRYADDIHFMGGAILCDKLIWGATAFSIANTPPDPEIVGEKWRAMWLERLENNGCWLLDWFRHQRRDEFYQHGSICENYSDIKIPVYAVGGYADGYTNAVFRMMQNLPGPKKALIGPWAHKYPHFATPGPRIGFLQECLRWWDKHLKGIENNIMEEPAICVWIQDPVKPNPAMEHRPGHWVCESEWPPQTQDHCRYYISQAGLLKEKSSNSELIELCNPETAGRTAPTWCAYGLNADGPLDQHGESGLMTFFDSEPLDKDMVIFGFPTLHAKVISNVPQANLIAVLSMVDTNNEATFISFGLLNLSHRTSHLELEPLPIGVPTDVQIQLNVIGQKIPAGNKLRLQLSTAYWPMIWPSQEKSKLQLLPNETFLDLPLQDKIEKKENIKTFEEPEGATPMKQEVLENGNFHRLLEIDQATECETIKRHFDSGLIKQTQTGLVVRVTSTEEFTIHPRDPNSAQGVCRWMRSYQRGNWKAELTTEISVRALKSEWDIHAELTAHDQNGEVLSRQWHEKIARDLV